MNRPCFEEDRILAALSSGSMADELRNHAADCAECTEILALASALRNQARAEAAGTSVPDADIIWWKAQLRHRREAVKRATLPIRLAQGFAALCVVAVAVIGFQLLQFPSWLTPELERAAPLNPVMAATGALAIACAMIAGVYLAIAERTPLGRV